MYTIFACIWVHILIIPAHLLLIFIVKYIILIWCFFFILALSISIPITYYFHRFNWKLNTNQLIDSLARHSQTNRQIDRQTERGWEIEHFNSKSIEEQRYIVVLCINLIHFLCRLLTRARRCLHTCYIHFSFNIHFVRLLLLYLIH